MARRRNTVTEENTVSTEAPEVDVVESDEVETILTDQEAAGAGEADPSKAAAKPKKEKARGDLPEGYVTPVGLAKEITARQLHKNKDGVVVDCPPQMVYSYKKNAPTDDPFPTETVTDSLGKEREALKVEDGIAWWERKNERAAARKANGAAKAVAKAAKAAETPAVEVEGDETAEVVEAE